TPSGSPTVPTTSARRARPCSGGPPPPSTRSPSRRASARASTRRSCPPSSPTRPTCGSSRRSPAGWERTRPSSPATSYTPATPRPPPSRSRSRACWSAARSARAGSRSSSASVPVSRTRVRSSRSPSPPYDLSELARPDRAEPRKTKENQRHGCQRAGHPRRPRQDHQRDHRHPGLRRDSREELRGRPRHRLPVHGRDRRGRPGRVRRRDSRRPAQEPEDGQGRPQLHPELSPARPADRQGVRNVSANRVRVVVTGLGATTPVGGDVTSSWSALLAGQSGVATLTEDWIDTVPVTFAGTAAVDPAEVLPRPEARRLDRSEQFAMVAAREAWQDAGAPEVASERLGVVVSSGIGGINTTLSAYDTYKERGWNRLSPFTVPMLMPNGPAAWIGLDRGAQPGVHATVSACASGAEAIGYAM